VNDSLYKLEFQIEKQKLISNKTQKLIYFKKVIKYITVGQKVMVTDGEI